MFIAALPAAARTWQHAEAGGSGQAVVHLQGKPVTHAQREWISKQLHWAKEAKARGRGDLLYKSTCTQFQKMQMLLCLEAGQCGLGRPEGLHTGQFGVVDMSLILTEVVVS